MNRRAIPFLLTLLAAAAALLCSCASGQGQAPAGGPRDSIPPIIESSDPPSGTINYSGNTVSVDFSEYVQESTVPEAVVITPIPARPPEFSWSGSSLDLEFVTPLAPNRTYAVTFGAGITDLDGNRLGRPVTIRFSTGSTIDSGIVRGQVLGVERRRVFVFAYQVPADAARFADTLRPENTRPDLIAPVADDGSFSLEALPPGTFRLIAVADEFGDQIYSPGTDAFGVAPYDVRVDSAYTPVSGVTFRIAPGPIDIAPPALYSARSVNRSRTELRFSEPIDTATILPASFTISTSLGPATITTVWQAPNNRLAVLIAHDELPPTAEATARARSLRDTIGNPLPDTLGEATFTVSEFRDSLPPVLLPILADTTRPYAFPDPVTIAFDEAVLADNLAGAVSLVDSAGRRAAFRLARTSPASFTATPIDSLAGALSGAFTVELGRFADPAGNRTDTTARIRVRLAQARQVGTLEGTIVDSTASDAVHVLILRHVPTGQIYRRAGVRSGPWQFPGLPEGEYEVSAFRDVDNDGEYDTGSLSPFRPAEPLTTFGVTRVRPRFVGGDVRLVFTR